MMKDNNRTMNGIHTVKIICTIITFCVVSLTLIFANKFLVGQKSTVTDVSIFVVWIQCIIIVTVLFLGTVIRALWSGNWQVVKINHHTLLSGTFLSLGLATAGMLAFNSLCLRYVNVSFYQVAKSTNVIFIVILSILILKRPISWRVWLCCLVVSIGFLMGIDQEDFLGTLSVKGVQYGVISSLFVAFNGIFIKQALDAVDGDSFEVTYLTNITAVIVMIPLVYLTGQLQEVIAQHKSFSQAYWMWLLATGVLSLLMSWIGNVQIHLTSPITHHIIATMKSVIQTLMAVMYYREYKSVLWWVSILLVAMGAFMYTVVRVKESSEENQKLKKCSSDLENEKHQEKNHNGTSKV